MKTVKKALAAAVISVACGSAVASPVTLSGVNGSFSMNQTTDQKVSVYDILNPNYYELVTGSEGVTAAFALIDTDPEENVVSYELYTDADGDVGQGDTGDLLLAWTYSDLLGSSTVTGVTQYLAANSQYLLKMVLASPSTTSGSSLVTAAVPLPAAAWLFGSALMGLGIFRRRKQVAAV